MSDTAKETNDTVEDDRFTIEGPDETDEVEVETAEVEAEVPEEVEESTEEEVEIPLAAETEEADELEIEVEGEDEPASRPARKSRFARRIESKNRQIAEATDREAELTARLESLEEQNKLLRMKEEVVKPLERPRLANFEDTDAYEDALDAYTKYVAKQQAEELLQQTLTVSQKETQQQQISQKKEATEDAHYERVEKLGIKPESYRTAEDRAISIFGDDATEAIMGDPMSHVLLYHFGLPKNEGKAEYFSDLLRREPVKGLMEIGRYSQKLVVKPKHSTAPDPEVKIPPGSADTNDPRLKGVTFE